MDVFIYTSTLNIPCCPVGLIQIVSLFKRLFFPSCLTLISTHTWASSFCYSNPYYGSEHGSTYPDHRMLTERMKLIQALSLHQIAKRTHNCPRQCKIIPQLSSGLCTPVYLPRKAGSLYIRVKELTKLIEEDGTRKAQEETDLEKLIMSRKW